MLKKPILIISASDSSAAAGMQVDLRVAQELGVPVRCAVTALTVQGDQGVVRIDPADAVGVELAIRTAIRDEPGIGAIKIGLLTDSRIARSIASTLSDTGTTVPMVIDPVIRSTSGSTMASDAVLDAFLEWILPRATLLTPNAHELELLSWRAGVDSNTMNEQASALLSKGVRSILLTDGDSAADPCVDLLLSVDTDKPVRFSHPRIAGKTPRGTGCALSTAIAVFLSRGVPMEGAVGQGIDYVQGKIEASRVVGKQRLLFS
jgi:hydroxymethylpyrimidine/phosphomethylpyrimidine kinase